MGDSNLSHTLALCRSVEGRNPFRLEPRTKSGFRRSSSLPATSWHKKDTNTRTLTHEDLSGLGDENKTDDSRSGLKAAVHPKDI